MSRHRRIGATLHTVRLPIIVVSLIALPAAVMGAAAAFQPAGHGPGEIPRMGVDESEGAAALESYAATATGAQATILADRSVSPSEYRRAALAATECLGRALEREANRRDLPVTTDVGPLVSSADGFSLTYRYSVRAAPGEDLADLPASLMDLPGQLDAACRHRHLDDVERGYQIERLADPTFVAGVARQFRRCARDAGTPLPEDQGVRPGMADVVDSLGPGSLPVGFMRCVEAFPAVTHVPATG